MNQRRSLIGWLSACSIMPLVAVGVANLPAAQTLGAPTYTVYNAPQTTIEGSADVDIAMTPNSKYAFVVGANETGARRIRPVEIDTTPAELPSFNIDTNYPNLFPSTDPTTSQPVTPVVSNISIHPSGAYAIVTLRDSTSSNGTQGKAIFVAINQATGAITKLQVGGSDVDPATLGVFPDSVEIAPNGNYAVVANSDERSNTAGTIQIIDLREGSPTRFTVIASSTITPTLPGGDTLPTTDPQPETVAIAPNSARAFVTLQPNNAVTVVDVNTTTLATTAVTRLLPRGSNGQTRLHPDGISATDIGGTQYVVTADEGIGPGVPGGPAKSNTVSLFQVGSASDGPTLNRINSIQYPSPGTDPQKVDMGVVDGQLRAFVTFGASNQVGVLAVAASGLVRETEVVLSNGQSAVSNPEGIVVGPTVTFGAASGQVIVTANRGSRNVSVIFAQSSASPSPSTSPLPNKEYLPDVRQGTNP